MRVVLLVTTKRANESRYTNKYAAYYCERKIHVIVNVSD